MKPVDPRLLEVHTHEAEAPNNVRINSQSSIEPSWFPQTPVTL